MCIYFQDIDKQSSVLRLAKHLLCRHTARLLAWSPDGPLGTCTFCDQLRLVLLPTMGGCLASFLFSSVMSIEARASPILGKHYKTDPQPPAQGTTFKKQPANSYPQGQGLKSCWCRSWPNSQPLLFCTSPWEKLMCLGPWVSLGICTFTHCTGRAPLNIPMGAGRPLPSGLRWEYPGESESLSQVLAAFFSLGCC